LRSFAGTVREVLLRPARFYHNLDPNEPLRNPAIFASICGLISLILTDLFAPLDLPTWGEPPTLRVLISSADDIFNTMLIIVVAAIVLFFLSVVLVLVGAAIQHLSVRAFVWPRRNFGITLRVITYASAFLLFSWVPTVGYLASLYGLYLSFIGIRELHATTTTRALLAVLAVAFLWLVGASFLLLRFLDASGL
jgi:hypothetical protein